MSTPNSTVYFLPLGNKLTADQHHTYWFPSAEAQRNYFFTQNMYLELHPTQFIRVSDTAIKVALPKSVIDKNYSYMCIKNCQYDFGSTTPSYTYWYAFVVDTEYIADSSTVVHFKIDVLQTFLYSGAVKFEDAVVNRWHVKSDKIGEHRKTEPFSFQATEVKYGLEYELEFEAVLGLSTGTEYEAPTYGITGRTAGSNQYYPIGGQGGFLIQAGGEYFRFPCNGDYQHCLEEILESVKDSPDNVIDFYMCPTVALPPRGVVNSPPTGYSDIAMPQVSPEGDTIGALGELAFLNPTDQTSFDGYTPHNHKLYTSPYLELLVTNTMGQTMLLKFEEFKKNNNNQAEIKFKVEGNWVANPSVLITPINYAGSYGHSPTTPNGENYEYMLYLNQFPKCGYSYSMYKQWVSEKMLGDIWMTATHFADTLGRGAGRALGYAMGGMAGHEKRDRVVSNFVGGTIATGFEATFGLADDLAELTAKWLELQAKPEVNMQQPTADGVLPIVNDHGSFQFYTKAIKGYEAKMVDQYFDLYGYSHHEIENIETWLNDGTWRPYYRFIKTDDIHVNGYCNSRYKAEIETIFNRGITFWGSTAHPADEVNICDYSVDNKAYTR